jgi:uncharacterized protein YukE
MSDILYNFSQNNASLGDVNHGINGINQARDDIANVFNVLIPLYEGQGATALQEAHRNFDNMLQDIVQNMAVTQSQAQDQQDMMQQLDAQNAAAF